MPGIHTKKKCIQKALKQPNLSPLIKNLQTGDDYTTNDVSIDRYCKYISKDLKVWDSAYCDGKSGEYMKKLGYTDFDNHHYKTTVSRDYMDFLNEKSIKLINKYYKKDFEFFDYKML